ncbi:hypothetical protein [Streptomyces dysideae]|uniref:Uncharacterized protein n=1 Tax=Streptomyces dysideae TaxID=909626 RepID=A0A101UWZ7_9ACTN|nr:hypothetical protein [Streptomyces dysideae]KUO18417.1 hypothetical protein AQJ91_25625 [Streptomyces dysideae]
MTGQIDEPDDAGLSEDEWRRLARFDDASMQLTERENRLVAEALAPVISRVAEAMSIMTDFPAPAWVAVQDVIQRLAEYSTFITETVSQNFQSNLRDVFEALGNFAKRNFPENWGGVYAPSFKGLGSILIDEGIPLMWVPGPKVVESLLTAESASARRRIIGSRWKRIVSDCEAVLHGIDHPKLLGDRDFALGCVNALRDGHVNPAQALSANLLDTILLHLNDDIRKSVRSNHFKQSGVKFDLDEHEFRTALTFAPVWCAHVKFKADKKDTIPRVFARHASVHAVSRKQYSRINAVIGLMVVTSVLKFFDTQMSR